MMKEYDFRFPGLDPLREPAKARRLRDCLLELAGGFTEIPQGALLDLLPGVGAGYLVALPDDAALQALQAALERLADEWHCALPVPRLARDGPRGHFGFFLVPELANRDAHGYRRPLFSPERWLSIRQALTGKLSHPAIRVYGEWKPLESGRLLDRDVSFMFVFRCDAETDAAYFKDFIQRQVFDWGRECDQETIYLSVRGEGRYIYDPSLGR